MNRRHFLKGMFAGATALAFAPIALRAENLTDTAAEFARGLDQHAWLAGWKSVGVESFAAQAATIEGRWPQELAGVLYRNGPARFERAGLRYQHWFDGDGMLHAWKVGKGSIEHRARMVETPKFKREQRAGRFVVPAAGTTIENAESIRNNDDVNTANTAVMCIGNRVFALWEAGSAFEVTADDLATIGPLTFRDDLTAMPFSAHPLRDRDGSIWNFGSLGLLGASGLLIWHVGSDGKLIRAGTIKDEQQGYLHSFAMTERHLVFVLTPYRMGEGEAFFERMRLAGDLPCRVAVVAKDVPDSARWFDVDFGMVYHFADAFERGPCVPRDIPMLRRHVHRWRQRCTGTRRRAAIRLSWWSCASIWARAGRAGSTAEFAASNFRPSIRVQTRPDTRVSMRQHEPLSAKAPWPNAITAVDLHHDRQITHSYGDSVLAEEHLFVPKRG